MNIRCPECRQPIEVEGDLLSDLTCPSCGSHFSLINEQQETAYLPTRRRIAHFDLLEQVGEGAFGVVWKARDTTLDRLVAIKIPRRGQLSAEESEFFFRDAQAAAQVHHPNVVSVFEVGRDGDTIFIACQYVQGVTLAEWVKLYPPTPREAAEMMASIAAAVQHAHERGVVHRDLKPGNILIDGDGEPHVTDFGLAKRENSDVTVTADGHLLGTPAYMSPEQARGEGHRADARSDVYSLGVILFELLTGERPFRGSKQMLALQIINDEPPIPRKLNARVPRDLETICLKCLEKDPRLRYTSSQSFADDLQRYLSGEPILARPITRLGRIYRWAKRQPAVAALSLSLIAALAAGVLGASRLAIRAAEGRASRYHQLVQRVQAARLSGEDGYVALGWKDLEQARWIDTSDVDLHALRQEAVLCLGDFRGYQSKPALISSADRDISACAIHPDGKWLAIGHSNGRIELRDPNDGSLIREMSGAANRVAALCFADDGKSLSVVEEMGRVLNFTLGDNAAANDQGEQRAVLHVGEGLSAGRKRYDLSSDAQSVVVHDEQRAELWSLKEQKRLLHVEATKDRKFISARVSPDGRWLAASDRTSSDSDFDRLRVWSVATGEERRDTEMNRGHGFSKSLAFSHDSSLVAYGGEGLAIFRLPAFEMHLSSPGDAIKCVAFSPDKQLLAFVQIRGDLVLWSPAAGHRIARLSHPRSPGTPLGGEAVAFSRNGQFLASLKPDSVKVWNLLKANERIALAGHDNGVPSLAFGASENLLASSSKDQKVRIWDLAARRTLRTIDLDGPVQCLAFSPNGKWLATGDGSVADSVPKTLNIWSMTDDQFRKVIPHDLGTSGDHSVTSAAFSPDGNYLAACANGMTLWRVTETSGAANEIDFDKTIHIDGEASLFVTFSSDSQLVMWTDKWDRMRGWDIHAKTQIDLPAIMNQGWHGLAFVNDGLAFVGADGALKIWDPRANKLLHTLGQQGEFQSPHIAAAPDRAYLAAVQSPETVALWDMRENQKLFHLRPERSEVWSLAFSPKGTKLAIGLSDGGVAVWDLKRINQALKVLDLAWRSDWNGD